jgi:hypothetical protein
MPAYCRCRHSAGQADLGQPRYIYGVGPTNSDEILKEAASTRSVAPRI